MALIVMPDPVAVTLDYLRSVPELAGFAATFRADLNGYESGQRWVKVTRSGGTTPIRYALAEPRVDVNCYAESKYETSRLARTAHAALLQWPPGVYGDAVILDVPEERATDPADLADIEAGEERFVFSVVIALRPF